jgi:HAD superfamily hydrolase (TIGR01509 family)
MYQAVLFDMDGVVVDTQDSVRAFWQQLAHEEDCALSHQDLEEHVYGHRADHTLRMLFPQIPLSRYHEVYQRLRCDQQSTTYQAISGVLGLLRQLHDAGIPLALVTGAQDWKMTEVLDQLGLAATFNVRVCADDVPVGKPDPACYLRAATCLSVDITRCIVFEDAVSGVTAAVSAGAACVAIAPRYRVPTALAAGALTSAHDFAAITFQSHDYILRVADKAQFPFRDGQG